jgi:hypothetical protein
MHFHPADNTILPVFFFLPLVNMEKQPKKGDFCSRLPAEVWHQILRGADASALCSFRLASRQCYALTTSRASRRALWQHLLRERFGDVPPAPAAATWERLRALVRAERSATMDN